MWILYTIVFGYDFYNSTDILWLSPHPWDAPVNGYMEVNEWMNEWLSGFTWGEKRAASKCSSCFYMLVTMEKLLVNVSDITHVKALQEMCIAWELICCVWYRIPQNSAVNSLLLESTQTYSNHEDE
jgi:hypothetical protein